MNISLMYLRFSRGLLLLVLYATLVQARAQGTIRFGFEEFALGTHPSYVTEVGPFLSHITVANSSTAPYVLLEGDKFLSASATITIASPDGRLIKEFSLYFFTHDTTGLGGFGAGNFVAKPEDYGKWTKASGFFEAPVPSITVSGIEIVGEVFPIAYAIDDVEFVTIPEPASVVIIVGGLGVLTAFRRLKSNHTEKRPRASEGCSR